MTLATLRQQDSIQTFNVIVTLVAVEHVLSSLVRLFKLVVPSVLRRFGRQRHQANALTKTPSRYRKNNMYIHSPFVSWPLCTPATRKWTVQGTVSAANKGESYKQINGCTIIYNFGNSIQVLIFEYIMNNFLNDVVIIYKLPLIWK